MERSVKFTCIDCNGVVFAWFASGRQRCAVCQWIHTTPNLAPEDVEEIRRLTGTPVLKAKDEKPNA